MRCRTPLFALLALALSLPATGCGSSDGTSGTVEAKINGEGDPQVGAKAEGKTRPARQSGDPLHPIVEVHTSAGVITLKLDAENAPGTVRNFLNYVNSSHYDDTIFHYVDQGAMILGGGFTPALEMKPTQMPIRNEAHNGVKNKAGTVAISHTFGLLDSGTCQFFINLKDNPALDHQGEDAETYGYCVFGEVTSGLDVAEQIASADVEQSGEFVNLPKERVVIKTVKFIR